MVYGMCGGLPPAHRSGSTGKGPGSGWLARTGMRSPHPEAPKTRHGSSEARTPKHRSPHAEAPGHILESNEAAPRSAEPIPGNAGAGFTYSEPGPGGMDNCVVRPNPPAPRPKKTGTRRVPVNIYLISNRISIGMCSSPRIRLSASKLGERFAYLASNSAAKAASPVACVLRIRAERSARAESILP